MTSVFSRNVAPNSTKQDVMKRTVKRRKKILRSDLCRKAHSVTDFFSLLRFRTQLKEKAVNHEENF